jgi:hypothetical protein
MGKALALIFTGCGIMLLLNFCIFFIVDNIRNHRNRNRSSIIKRSRQNRRRSVSFADPLVKQTMPKRGPSQPEEIEMVDLSSIPALVQDPPPPPPPPKPLTSLNRQKQPRRATNKVSRPTSPPPCPPQRPLQTVPAIQNATLPRQPVRKAPPVPSAIAPGPLAPPSLTRSMSVRQPHRDKVYKTFTIIIILS